VSAAAPSSATASPRAPSSPDTAAPARRERLPTVRTERCTVRDLSPGRRATLLATLYPVFAENLEGFDEETFRDRVLFRAPDARLGLYYAADGQLVGFSSVVAVRFRVRGCDHLVLDAGTHIASTHHGGRRSMIFGGTESARIRLRHPRTPLWYVPELTNPAPYRLLASHAAEFYPSPDRSTPPEVTELLEAVRDARGMTPVGPPLVARFANAARGTRAERFRLSPRMANDPLVQHFISLNPGFASGDDLLFAYPLHTLNLLTTALPVLCAPVRRLFFPPETTP